MMVIRRKVGEAIRINNDIKLVIHEIQKGRIVRFGIEAPEHIAVHRLEVYQEIQHENQASVAGNALAWLKQDG